MFICGCCTEQFVNELREIHHKLPREYDGKDSDDNLIDLCEHCHSIIHKTAQKLIKGVNPLDFIEHVYNYKQSVVNNALDLADIIVRAANSIEKKHRKIQQVSVPLEFNFYNFNVKDAAAACKLPVYKFIVEAVEEKVRQINGRIDSGAKVQTKLNNKPKRKRV